MKIIMIKQVMFSQKDKPEFIGELKMKENIMELMKLGKIPNDDDMSDEIFNQFDELIQTDEPLTFEEARLLITLFSDDCDDLNWGLLHLIESIDIHDNIERYRILISNCNNTEFKEILEIRLNNTLEKNK